MTARYALARLLPTFALACVELWKYKNETEKERRLLSRLSFHLEKLRGRR